MTDRVNEPTSLSILVVSEDVSGIDDETEIQEAGIIGGIKRIFVGRKDVPIQTIHSELDRVRPELDDILSKVDFSSKHGFRLNEVAISLGISAGGSIGVVTAGVEASITLTFSKE